MLILLTFSWFTSLMEATPCDSESSHNAIAFSSHDQAVLEASSTGAVGTDVDLHDCHAGSCHFGHCAHGYYRSVASAAPIPPLSAGTLLTPYSWVITLGSGSLLIEPPAFV
jgi:hypothetical protein